MAATSQNLNDRPAGVRMSPGRALALLAVIVLHALVLGWLALKTIAEAPRFAPIYQIDLVPAFLRRSPPPVERGEPGGGPRSAQLSSAPTPPLPVRPPLDSAAPVIPLPLAEAPSPPALAEPAVLPGGARGGAGGGQGAGQGDGMADAPVQWRDHAWLKKPGWREMLRYYPAAARRDREGGRVLLSCRIRLSTRVDRCRVLEESPRRYGFGVAALQAARDFRFRPPERDGRPVADWVVTIPVDFVISDGLAEPSQPLTEAESPL